ncbi:MAG TPA: glutathione S-transferase family protein [Steroidobacteraceae bacterium]|nr:glutathione S-transferase family protein [Steroidobacteraceae bacterium]
MITLYENAFSPFARKVRMALEHKGLQFEAIDGLRTDNQAALAKVNPRREVPVLVDGDITIINSSHIVQYLDEAYPQQPLLPTAVAARVRARHWERISDTLLDGILLNVSIWMWAERTDKRPPAMEERARADLASIYAALEKELAEAGHFIVGALSIADLACFPHLRSVKSLGFPIDKSNYPLLTQWLDRMESLPIGRDDVKRLKAFFANIQAQSFERRKIFWRGDRVEWLLASGQHEWLAQEIREGRVLWPSTRLSPREDDAG